MDNQTYCLELAAPEGSYRHYAALWLQGAEKPFWLALNSIFIQLKDCVDKTSTQEIARTKLSWWQNELERTLSGNPNHPATQYLLANAQNPKYRIDLNALLPLYSQIIQSIEQVARYPLFDNTSQWEMQTHQQRGSLLRQIELVCCRADLPGPHLALSIGSALQIAEDTLAMPQKLAQGYPLLPADWLARFNTDYESVFETLSAHEAAIPITEKAITFALNRVNQATESLQADKRPYWLAEYTLLNFYRAILTDYVNKPAKLWQNAGCNQTALWPLSMLYKSWRLSGSFKTR